MNSLDPSIPCSLDPSDESQPRPVHSLKDLVDAALRLDAELHNTRFNALTGEVIQAEACAIMDSKFPAAATEGGVCGTEAAPAMSQPGRDPLRPQTLSRMLRAVLRWWLACFRRLSGALDSAGCFAATFLDELARDGREHTHLR